MAIEPVPGRLTGSRIEQHYADGYWRDEVVGDLLHRHARERPDRVAVVDGDRRITWAELLRLSQRVALGLRELGLRPRDAVALQLPNWFEYLACYYGIQLAGAIVVQPGADWRANEMAYALGIGPARAAIVPASFRGHDYPATLEGLRPGLPELEHVLVARGEARGCVSLDGLLADPIEQRLDAGVLAGCRPGADEVVRIVFTSGTTGLPKAIMHTNNSIAHSSRTVSAAFGHDADDVCFMYVPFSTNYGVIMGLHLPLTTGARVVLMDRFSASGSLALIEREKITFVPGTPTAFIAMTHSPAIREHDLGSLGLLMSAGASFPVPAIRELRAAFPEATFIDAFGMNEFGMGLWCAPDDDPDEIDGAIGRPIAGLEARVVDAAGRALGPGETGELVIRSPGMCAGYHANPDANAAAWDEAGWFHSGDLATVDEQGVFRIVGRAKDLIIRGGANVSPREVEEALSTHPAVREVCVIGLPDDHYGEVVCACVIPNSPQRPTHQELSAYLETRIAAYKVPSRTVILEAFPLNSMGKVQKSALLQQVLEAP